MINESYYVPININYQQGTSLTTTLPMSVLISNSSTVQATKIYTNLQQVQSDYASQSSAVELSAATMYFNNGGQELLIYNQGSSTSDTDAITALLASYNNFIWVTFAQEKNITELQAIATALANANQQYPKFLAMTSNVEGAPATLNSQGITNVALVNATSTDTLVPYSAIVIPAYFSGINLSKPNSLQSMIHTVINGVVPSDITESALTTAVEGNWNAIVNLAGRYIVFDGGTMVDGQPIHSAWGFAIFKKNCEDTLTDLLITKLPYANSSNVVIENAISKVCDYFVTNGLIGTDKIYNLSTQQVEYNGTTYTTIQEGQSLSNGYYIYSIPISTASSTDMNAGRIPPVYIYAIISGVIRIVTIIGEVSK